MLGLFDRTGILKSDSNAVPDDCSAGEYTRPGFSTRKSGPKFSLRWLDSFRLRASEGSREVDDLKLVVDVARGEEELLSDVVEAALCKE